MESREDNHQQPLQQEQADRLRQSAKADVVENASRPSSPQVDTELYHEIASSYSLDSHAIEQILPCTPMQDGLLSLASRSPDDYVMHAVLELDPGTCQDAFGNAWARVSQKLGILRTRFVQSRHGILQVVMKHDFSLKQGDDLDTQLRRHRTLNLGLGHRLSHYSFVKDENQGKRWFIWTVHHALYDGWLLSRITREVSNLYAESSPDQELQDFETFVDYTQQQDNDKAQAYWRSTLAGFEGNSFPSRQHASSSDFARVDVVTSSIAGQDTGFRDSTLINAAWAIVASQHSATDDVVFGTIASGRSRSVPLTLSAAGPTIATVPLRVRFGDQDAGAYLTAVEAASTSRQGYEHIGLPRISSSSPDAEQACRFETLLIFQPSENDLYMPSGIGRWLTSSKDAVPQTYALTVQCFRVADSALKLQADFDTSLLGAWTVQNMLHQFAWTLKQLATKTNLMVMIEDFMQLPPEEHEQIWRWNADVPSTINRCVHEAIAEQALAQPSAMAICAWDGSLTYQELDQKATSLAAHLASLGITPSSRSLVPLLFEKSFWTSVAMLAVLKAGGTFILLDPMQPPLRLAAVVRQIQPDIILSSASCTTMSLTTSCTVIAIDQQSHIFTQNPYHTALESLRPVNPTSDAYVIFTSGSTGEPKGVCVPHNALASSCHYHGAKFGLNKASRVFQFTSYAFDVSLMELLTTLVYGGSVCVPSSEERVSDTAISIKRLEANTLFFTPSMSRIIEMEAMAHVDTVILGGEMAREEDFKRWRDNSGATRLINAYGPAECTIFSSSQPFASGPNIGWAMGAVNWVVDSRNHEKLAPLGAVGELLIEGPIVGRGYLGDSRRTGEVFVTDPCWLVKGTREQSGRRGRLYKTGDLVRYNENGSLTYIGRRDNQIKIRGQRIESGEVEHLVHSQMTWARQVVVELVSIGDKISGDNSRTMLIGFLKGERPPEQKPLKSHGVSAHIYSPSETEEEHLASQIPVHMMPNIFFVLEDFPITPSGKTDRRKLRDFADTFTSQMRATTHGNKSKRAPETAAERSLQKLWTRLLKLNMEEVGRDDNFFRLGGDSIAAMKLSGEARKAGMILSVADIFRYPQLKDAAKLRSLDKKPIEKEVPPFSLLKGILKSSTDVATCCQQIASSYDLALEDFEDIYPCTPLQEGLFALSLKVPGDYILTDVLEFSYFNVSVDRLQRAWEQVVQATPILRTRLVQHSDLGLLQVVLAEGVRWEKPDSLDKYLEDLKHVQMGLGQPLARYGIIRHPGTNGHMSFVLTLHHVLYDGASLSTLRDHLVGAYDAIRLEIPPPFCNFSKYIMDQDKGDATTFWRSALEGYDFLSFPALPSSRREPTPDSEIIHRVALQSSLGYGTTLASVTRAAWALTMWRYSGSSDVVFGAVVSGKNAPIHNIEHIMGPTIATVPVRIQVDTSESISTFVGRVQKQAVDMIPFEQTGLRQISAMSRSAQQACDFQTLIVIQPPQDGTESSLGSWRRISEAHAFTNYAVTITCYPESDGRDGGARTWSIQATFDSATLPSWVVKRMLDYFSTALQRLLQSEQGNVSDLGILHPADVEQVWHWNETVPAADEHCIHELFANMAQGQPDTVAIEAWDGTLTYGQLDDLSSRLALRLVEAGPGPLVPLCFEKSMWTTVAMLGVVKAGSAFVLLDATQPKARLSSVIAQIDAKIILSSVDAHSLSKSLVDSVVTIGNDLIPSATNLAQVSLPQIQPSAILYVVFTSGSTGAPKGVLISHSNFSSAIQHQNETLLFSKQTIHFDFMGYAFDVAIHNTLATLLAGGCLCVPSEEARKNDLSNAMNQFQVNSASLTPSVARLLNPSKLTSLESLILIGEAVTKDDAESWSKIKFINGYGPAECTPYSTARQMFLKTEGGSEVTIGKAIGSATWIVDGNNHQKLTPIGAVGELLIEGPIVGQGYLKNPERTAEAFVQDPDWLILGSTGHAGRNGRLYKTGDLVRYDEDGSLIYIGRKDTQVKIRGQRVELGEIEHHVRNQFIAARQVAAEAVTYVAENARPALVAFIEDPEDTTIPNGNSGLDIVQASGLSARTILQDKVVEELRKVLPEHMIPTLYLGLKELPMTPSGKMDRKRLRELACSLPPSKLAAILGHSSSQGRRDVNTETERTLQKLWARIFGRDAQEIWPGDNFFHLGGDSISSMQLVGLCRDQGLRLTIAEIFRNPRLEELAALIREDVGATPESYAPPYSLLADFGPSGAAALEVSASLPSTAPEIIDVLPLTDFQRYCVRNELEPLSPTRHYFYLDYPPETPDAVLHSSCSMLTSRFDALRIIFFEHQSTLLQALPVDYPPSIKSEEFDGEYMGKIFNRLCTEDLEHALPLGNPFTQFTILRSRSAIRLVLRLSHAQYDGMSLGFMAESLGQHYRGTKLSPVGSFSSFIYYCHSSKKERYDYWASVLGDCKATWLPLKSSQDNDEEGQIRLEDIIQIPKSQYQATPATLFTAACAVSLARITGSSDVVFGRLVSGRGGLPPTIQNLVGPYANTAPVRAQFASDNFEMADIIEKLQYQYAQSSPHEAVTLGELGAIIKDWAGWGLVCQYQSIDINPVAHLGTTEARLTSMERPPPEMLSRTILVSAEPEEGGLKISVTASRAHNDEKQISLLYHTLREHLTGSDEA